ncbi:MAG: NUDIX hydrolase, partial [Serratia liquefaciens]|nr:NUDIX hydrolase [Serratia liquefaciens]
AHRLIAQCQAIYRIEGASAGADNDVRLANEWGMPVYYRLDDIPQLTP